MKMISPRYVPSSVIAAIFVLGIFSQKAHAVTYNFEGTVDFVGDTIAATMHPTAGTFLGHPFVAGEKIQRDFYCRHRRP